MIHFHQRKGCKHEDSEDPSLWINGISGKLSQQNYCEKCVVASKSIFQKLLENRESSYILTNTVAGGKYP